MTCGYTGDGLRAWKQAGSGGKTYFLYDGEQPVCELGSTGSVTAVNTFGADGLTDRHTSAGTEVYSFSQSGNVSERTNGDGTNPYVLSVDTYDAFGNRTSTATGTPDPFGFGGQYGYYTDSETGLVLCTHRFYDPQAGRFLTRDPMGYAGGVNLYAYVGNNPVNESDPLGLWTMHLGLEGVGYWWLVFGGGYSGGLSFDGTGTIAIEGDGWSVVPGTGGGAGSSCTLLGSISNGNLPDADPRTGLVFNGGLFTGDKIGPVSVTWPIDDQNSPTVSVIYPPENIGASGISGGNRVIGINFPIISQVIDRWVEHGIESMYPPQD